MLHLNRTETFLVILLAWVAIYLPGLGVPEIQVEEGRRILPAVTMLKTDNWLVPHIGGEAYYRKPPFINWLIAGSFALTGQQNEWSARLPSALSVLGFAGLLIWLPGAWLRVEARLIAAVIFLTSFGVIKKGRVSEIEAVYVSLTSMAVLTWLALWVRGRSRWALWLVPGVFLTCGMLTKGPPILVFYYVPVVCILIYSKRLRAMLSVPHLLSLALCLGLPALWAYAASHQAASRQEVIGQLSETIERLTPAAIDWSQWITQALRSFANPLPWLFFLPLLWMRAFTGPIEPIHQPVLKGARLGLVIAFLAITVIPGNSGRYSMPAIGLESILLGWVLAEIGALPDEGRLWRRSALTGYAVTIPLAAVGLAGVRTDLWAAIILLAAVCLTVVLIRRRGLFRTPVHLALLSAVLVAVLMLEYSLFMPRLMQRGEIRRPIGTKLNSLVPADETLYVYKPGCQDFLFYVREPLEYLVEPGQIDSRVHYLLLGDAAYQQFQAEPALAAQLGGTLHSFTYRRHGEFRLVKLLAPTP
jgi:4-amino-4-deoxy-L-arabinose transferase-like glycosyltransferase